MFQSDSHQQVKPWDSDKPVLTFGVLSIGLLVAVGVLAKTIFGVFIAPVVLFAIIAALSLRSLLYSYPHTALGACNTVTLCRAALVAVLAGAIFGSAGPWMFFTIATIAFALDAIDGWLARRSGLVSAFGQRFDMEVDALLGAVIAVVLLSQGTVGPEVLVLGFSRYVFVAAGFIWPALQADLPQSLRRKTICVVQIAALIVLVFPLSPSVILMPISVFAAMLLLWSFAVDTLFLMRHAA